MATGRSRHRARGSLRTPTFSPTVTLFLSHKRKNEVMGVGLGSLEALIVSQTQPFNVVSFSIGLVFNSVQIVIL